MNYSVITSLIAFTSAAAPSGYYKRNYGGANYYKRNYGGYYKRNYGGYYKRNYGY